MITRSATPGRVPSKTTLDLTTNIGAAANGLPAIALAGGGAKNVYTAAATPALAAYTAGQVFVYTAGAADNDAAATLNVDSLGAKAVVTNANAALSGGELVNGSTYLLTYDGTSFRVLA